MPDPRFPRLPPGAPCWCWPTSRRSSRPEPRSRRRLELEGEQEFIVLPLPTPSGGRGWVLGLGEGAAPPNTTTHYVGTRPAPNTLLQYPSVALFVDRARAARPDFALTSENAAAV